MKITTSSAFSFSLTLTFLSHSLPFNFLYSLNDFTALLLLLPLFLVDEFPTFGFELVDVELVDAELVGAELVDAELVDAELVNGEL